jgi:regulator of sigma E protease
MSIILFLLVLFILVLVHEWGHFIVAKKTGMQVDEFAIGFPPRLFSFKWGETEYSFNLLPIGGYVKILGENPQTAEETMSDPRSFAARPRWAQALVLIAGVTMNVIFAWLLFVATFMIGVPTAVDEEVATAEARLHIAGILPESPLAEVLPPGSEIVSLAAADTTLETLTPSAFTAFVQTHATTPLTIGFIKDEETFYETVTPVQGLIPDDSERYAVGVSLVLVETTRESLVGAVGEATGATMQGLVDITVGLAALLKNTVNGTADFSDVAGPVGIVGLVGDAASYGLTSLLMFTAMISLNLAVINMLPVPALDGGRLVFVAIEAVIRRPLNPNWTIWLNLIGFALLMLLMVVITWHDIAKLL